MSAPTVVIVDDTSLGAEGLSMLRAVARWCHRGRWIVLGLWLALLAGTLLSGEGEFTHDFETPGDSSVASQLMNTHFDDEEFADVVEVVVRPDDGRVTDPAVRERVNGLLDEASTLPHVAETVTPYQDTDRPMISDDRTVAVGEIHLDVASFDVPENLIAELLRIRDEAETGDLRIELGGQAVRDYETDVGGSAELIGFAAALVILVLLFGSPIAALLPLITAGVGLGTGLALIDLLSRVTAIPGFAPQLATMIGIGVGIDYAMFVVTRFRRSLASGYAVENAVVHAMATAGRAVLIAGCTVVMCLLAVQVTGQSDVAAVGLGASMTVLTMMLVSVTMLPALLSVTGHRVNWWSWRRFGSAERGWTRRWVTGVQRRPVLWAVAAGIPMLVLCIPAFSLRMGTTDASDGPTGATSRQAYEIVAEAFTPGHTTPIHVVADLRDVPDDGGDARRESLLRELESALGSSTGVDDVRSPVVSPDGDVAVLDIHARYAPQDEASEELVRRLRADVLPDVTRGSGATTHVGGFVATNLDNADRIRTTLVWLFTIVIGSAILLLLVTFRSLLIPLKAAAMNLLTIGAGYGAMVAVFQWGWGITLLGLPGGAPIDSVLPVLMFAIAFGLSMDYEVFLLSRIREEWTRTGDNSRSVAVGMQHTAGVITAAGAIMVTVFAAFMLGSDRQLKMFGFGFAVPILLDVVVIRLVLVPALMELMGRANWYLPGWLNAVLPRLPVERSDEAADAPRVPEPTG